MGGYSELTIILPLFIYIHFLSLGQLFMFYTFFSQQQDGCYSRIDFFIVHSCTHTYLNKWCHVSCGVQLLRLVFMDSIIAMETRNKCICLVRYVICEYFFTSGI